MQDLDEETLGRIDFQNQVQTLMEELEFLRRVHEQEVKELQALLAQAPADTREFFKNELALAIRDIKDEYDYIAKQGKQDMESWYKLKVLISCESLNYVPNYNLNVKWRKIGRAGKLLGYEFSIVFIQIEGSPKFFY